jgi:hypothetical protein
MAAVSGMTTAAVDTRFTAFVSRDDLYDAQRRRSRAPSERSERGNPSP